MKTFFQKRFHAFFHAGFLAFLPSGSPSLMTALIPAFGVAFRPAILRSSLLEPRPSFCPSWILSVFHDGFLAGRSGNGKERVRRLCSVLHSFMQERKPESRPSGRPAGKFAVRPHIKLARRKEIM